MEGPTPFGMLLLWIYERLPSNPFEEGIEGGCQYLQTSGWAGGNERDAGYPQLIHPRLTRREVSSSGSRLLLPFG
jgi:hypothetical protein